MIGIMNRWKKGLSIAVAAAVLCNPIMPLGKAITQEAHAASKAAPTWAEPYLQNLVNRNILRGDENGDLRANDKISRAEFAALVNRTYGFDIKGTKKFTDVKQVDWFSDDISIAANQGFLAGVSASLAGPNDFLTREQAVTMLCRAVKIPEENIDPLTFTDSKKFEFWSKGSIYAATDKGFVSGFSDQTFRPQQSITRAEVSKMLSDMSGEIVDESTQVRFGYVNGNVTLSDSGAGLRNTTINGDLYITEGVGAGFVILDGVTVLGDVIISGCGESNVGSSSIIAYDCNFKNVIIDVGHDKTVSLIAEGDSIIENTVVKSRTYLEERNNDGSAFRNVQLNGPENTALDLSGAFETVTIKGYKNILNLRKGSVERLIADEVATEPRIQLDKNTYVDQLYTDTATTVTGPGEIDSIVVQTNGTKVEGLPNDITIRPGVIANIDGKDMTYDDAERDKATPEIDSAYPKIIDIQPTAATAVVKVNKPGKIYWIVKRPFSNAPSTDNLKEPKKDTGVIASGNFTIASDKEVNTQLSGLLSGEDYVFYAMLEDMRENYSSVESELFKTVDNVKPAMITGYPQAVGVFDEEGHKLKYTLVPSKTGSIYWVTLPKGSIAPTVDLLISDPKQVPGALDAGKENCTKNTVSEFFAKGLKEATVYDTYMAVKDESGNNSTMYKITASTLDVTPPEFQKNYPKLGTITNTSANILFMTDETCTLYWALYPRGTKVPSSYEPGPIGPLYSPEAQQEVITGNSALKFGKANATVDKEGNFAISGLTAETPYDLYFVLEDKSGNKSLPVLLKEINTKDDIAPTAKLEFDPAYVSDSGEPKVGSDIRLVFSEIVYDGTATTKTTFAGVTADRLGNFIQIYDTSSSPRVQLATTGAMQAIDFSKAVFSEENGKTILTFSTGENLNQDAKALKLASGNRYVFELRSIVDSAGNKMKTNAAGLVTKLDEFRTMSPFIALKDLGSSTSGAYDVSFEVDPQIQNASTELCFDVIVETDTQMTCNIRKETTVNGAPATTTYATNVAIEPKKYYAMQALFDGKVEANYTPFNDLTKTTYYITVTNLDGVGDRKLWNKKLTMDFRGVSGTNRNLVDAAFAGESGTFDDTLKNLKISVVSDPLKLTCNKYFSDQEAPKFETDYPILSAGDTSVGVRYMTDKACTVYWLLAPAGTIKDMPDPIKIIEGSIRPAGSKQGKIAITSGKTEFAEVIRELQANTPYEFYYVAKGNTYSETFMKYITTAAVVTPQFANGYPAKDGQGDGEAYLKTKVVDADANVFWVCFEAGVKNITGTGGGIEITAEEIAGAAVRPESRVIDSGELILQENGIARITVKNLKADRFYDVFMVARNPLADPLGANWSNRAAVLNITGADTVPPAVVKGTDTTTILSYAGVAQMKYNGVFNVTFTEALSYRDTSSGTRHPLTEAVLRPIVEGNTIGKFKFTGTHIEAGGGLIGFEIKFEDTMANSTIQFKFPVLDSAGNEAGIMVMKFLGNKDDPYSSYWDIQFVK